MKRISYQHRLSAMIMAGMMLFASGSMSVFAAGAEHSAEISLTETQYDSGNASSKPTASEAKVQAIMSRLAACCSEMEVHAEAMIAAAKANDLNQFKSEDKAYADCEKRIQSIYNEIDSSFTSEQVERIKKDLNKRRNAVQKIYNQAKSSYASNIQEAEDNNGNSYSISKVKYSVQRISEGSASGITRQALGSGARDGAAYAFYKVTLRVGTTRVHLVDDKTMRVSGDLSDDIQGTEPRLYRLDAEGGTATAARIGGMSLKKPWKFSASVSKEVTYFVVEFMPESGRQQAKEGQESVAVDEAGKKYTADQLRGMLVISPANDQDAGQALSLANAKAETSEVYSVSLPEGFALLPGTMATVELVCQNAADRQVTVSRIVKNTDNDADEVPYLSESLGEFYCDKEGKLVFQTTGFSSFVIDWSDKSQQTDSVSPSDAKSGSSVWVWLIIVIAAAAVAALGAAAFVIFRRKS